MHRLHTITIEQTQSYRQPCVTPFARIIPSSRHRKIIRTHTQIAVKQNYNLYICHSSLYEGHQRILILIKATIMQSSHNQLLFKINEFYNYA